MISFTRRAIDRLLREMRETHASQFQLQLELERIHQQVATTMPGNPAAFGRKIYSQCDEDGVVSHIFDCLGDGDRTFTEIGCGDGRENNTHALLLKGWRGAWIDADETKIRDIREHLPDSRLLQVRRAKVTKANAAELLQEVLGSLAVPSLDFLSVDIDGDDLGVVVSLLEGGNSPRVICIEYNAKFPPPLKVAIQRSRTKGWTGDDYYGASLSCICDALADFGYSLVACNASGVNAFFVQATSAELFPVHSVAQLYQPARYHLRHIESGHPASLRFLADKLSGT